MPKGWALFVCASRITAIHAGRRTGWTRVIRIKKRSGMMSLRVHRDVRRLSMGERSREKRSFSGSRREVLKRQLKSFFHADNLSNLYEHNLLQLKTRSRENFKDYLIRGEAILGVSRSCIIYVF